MRFKPTKASGRRRTPSSVSGSVTSERWMTPLTCGPGMAARQERRRARRACGLLAGSTRCAAQANGEGQLARWASELGEGAGQESWAFGPKVEKRGNSFSFSISSFPNTFSNSFCNHFLLVIKTNQHK
jgi:hypothetical protein